MHFKGVLSRLSRGFVHRAYVDAFFPTGSISARGFDCDSLIRGMDNCLGNPIVMSFSFVLRFYPI